VKVKREVNVEEDPYRDYPHIPWKEKYYAHHANGSSGLPQAPLAVFLIALGLFLYFMS
jgi:hypothetical protein